mmetsp:Transcript_39425/g.101068  ORF Transcript_39425/g.101068 Transcript_39425/m.101068 type:complete len:497 (-) Transcript_39425:319-1809(-)
MGGLKERGKEGKKDKKLKDESQRKQRDPGSSSMGARQPVLQQPSGPDGPSAVVVPTFEGGSDLCVYHNSGMLYCGEMTMGLLHGVGVLYFDEGFYAGGMSRNKMHGSGILYQKGSFSVGKWKDGVAVEASSLPIVPLIVALYAFITSLLARSKATSAIRQKRFDFPHLKRLRESSKYFSPQLTDAVSSSLGVFLLFFCSFFVDSLLSWNGGFLAKLVAFFLLIVGGFYAQQLHEMNDGTDRRSRLVQSFFISCVIATAFAYPLTRGSDFSFFSLSTLDVVFYVCVFFALFWNACASTCDPGRLDGDRAKQYREVVTKEANDLLSRIGFDKELLECPVCHISRPWRSKHCRKTNMCIASFDHYCPGVAGPIGAGNHLYFGLNVLFLVVGSLLFLIFAVSTLYSASTGAVVLPLYQWCVLITAVVVNIGNSGFFAPFVFYQLYLVSVNMTQNELKNQSRYLYLGSIKGHSNPFNKGIIRNWIYYIKDFLQVRRYGGGR